MRTFFTQRRAALLAVKAFVAAMIASAIAAQPTFADTNGYFGGTVDLDVHRPSYGTIFGSEGTAVVSDALEYPDVLDFCCTPAFDIDVTANQIRVIHTRDVTYDPNLFMGPVLINVSDIPNITGVSYAAGESSGPAPTLDFTSTEVRINLQGRSYTNGDTVVVNVTFGETDLPAVDAITPSLATIAEGDAGGSQTLTVEFDEPMNTSVTPTITFPTEDPSATLSFTSGSWTSDTEYAASYAITDADDVIADVDVRVAGAQDANGNTMTAETVADVFSINMPDTVDPTVAISGPAGVQTGAFTATFTFSESVTGFDVSDVVAGNATLSGFSGSGSSYSVTVDPSSDGAVTLDVAADAATDAGGNGNTAATQFSVTADVTHPTVAISGPAGPVNAAFTATFTFSESVTGFDVSDVTAGNATLSGFSGSGSSYSVTVDPSSDGAVTLDVAADAGADAAGNGNDAATQFSVTADLTDPTVAISGPAGPVSAAFTATFTFSESVAGFDVSDIVAGNATLSGFTGSGASYSVTVDPSADGAVTLDVAGDAATDVAGNGNTAALQFSVTADLTAPTVAISGPAGPVSAAFTATFTFSESVAGFDVSDIVAGNATLSGFTGSGSSYSVTVDPSSDGAVTLDVAADAATDDAGNGNTAATQFSVTADLTAPTVTISGPVGPVSAAFTATFTFSESVTGFDVSDIVAGNATLSGFSGSGSSYSVTVDPSSDGAVTLDVAADAGADAAGNGNDAATQFSVTADLTGPTAAISGPAGPVSAAFTATFTFSESVTGFDVSDVVAGNAALSGFTGSGSSYSVTVDPSSDGAVTLDVAADAATDDAGNGNTAATQFSVTADLTAPTVTISGPAGVQTGAFTATFTFSESMTGFGVSDVVAGNATLSGFSGSGASYSVTVDPSSDGAVTLDVASDAATDAAGNGNMAASQFSVDADITAPTVAISGPASPVTAAFTAMFTFSESVTGFDVSDVTAGNATLSGFSGSGSSYSVTVDPSADGAVTLNVAGDAATDAAGNGNDAATQFSVDADITAPTVVISGPAGPVTAAFTATFTFSEPVTGFDASDVVAGNATLSGFAGSGSSYSVTVDPSSDGAITLDVAGDAATDAAGNGNTAATQFSVDADITAPTVAISGPSGVQAGAFTATFTFSEDMTGFDVSDVVAGNATLSGFTGSGSSYSVTVDPSTDGAVTLDVAGDAATDAAGNGNAAATQFSVDADVTAPTVAISGPASPVTAAFTATVTFSEDVTGFDVSDVVAGNATLSGFTGSGASYSVTVDPSSDGAVTLDVAADVAADAAGNGNTVATQFSVDADVTAPTVAISGPSGVQTGVFTATFTFSEDVTGFDVSDVVAGNATLSGFTGSGASYSVTVEPSADGAVTLDVAGDAATDAAGNGNTAATQFSVDADVTAPGVALAGPSSVQNAAFDVTITFSEAVTGFDIADVFVGNGSASALSGSGASYTATIDPAADGSVTVTVDAGAATDAAGNANSAATPIAVDADITGPSTALSGPAAIQTGSFDVAVSFSEDVTGFAAGDVSVGNGSVTALSGSGADYTATITPAGDGAVTVDVAGGVAADGAGNANTAAAQFSVEADVTAPSIDAIVATPSILTDADAGAGALAVAVTFSEDMDTSVAPTLGFPSEDPTGSISFASSSWSGDARTYTAFYDVTDADEQIADVDVAVSGAQDAVGNALAAATVADVFSIDMPGGAIVIEKVVSGGDGTFEFTSGEASLTRALTTSGGTASFSVTNLAPGVYDIVEALHGEFELTDLACVDPDSGSSVDLASRSASIDLDNKETVTCTFTNTSKGSIIINQAVLGDDATFDYAGDLGAFSIAASGGAGSQSFANQSAGTYTVSLAALNGYTTTDLSCTGDDDGGTTVDVGAGTAVIDLDAGEAIACTFESTEDPAIDESQSMAVALMLPNDVTDPKMIASALPLTNTGGAPLSFSVANTADWLTVTPGDGTIPAGGTTNLMFGLTDNAANLTTGAHTAEVTISNLSAPSGSQAVTVTVTVTVEETDGTITIITTTAPALAGDATFSYASGDPDLGSLVQATAGGTAISQAFTKRQGVYTISQNALEEWRLDSISCIGDADGGTVIDPEARSAAIDLDAGEAIVCTFANVRDEDHVRAVTQRVIRSFMTERADRILSSSPSLVDRLRRRGSAQGGGLSANAANGRFTFNGSASLSGLRASQRVEVASADGLTANDASPERMEWDNTFDVWVSAAFDSVESNRSGLAEEADFGVIYVGADVLANDKTVVGALLQIDYMDTTSQAIGSTASGLGWMAGPYMVRRLSDNVYLDVRASVGGSNNDVNPLGLYEDQFHTLRGLFAANLTGDYQFDAWRVSPSLGLAFFGERQRAYTDSLGIDIPAQSISIGRVTAGPEFAYRFDRGDGAYIEPFGELTLVWDYRAAGVLDALGARRSNGDVRGAGRFGLSARLRNGGVLAAAVRLDGIGDEDLKATGAEVRFNVPFN